MNISFSLPYPISVNRMYANNAKHGRGRFKTKEYQSWIMEAGLKLNQQRVPTVRGRYFMDVTIQKPDNRRRDVFNLVKSVEDLLVGQGVVEDDSYCQGGYIMWDQSGKVIGARVELRHA